MLVDTNVILDVIEDDPKWATWSQQQLEAGALKDVLIINPVIYAELTLAFRRIEELGAMLAKAGFRLDAIPREALFLAGKAFLQYRRKGGAKTGVLPNFFIGAHAAVENIALITRDTARYCTYFPKLQLITPQ